MHHMGSMGMWLPPGPPTWGRLFRLHLDTGSVLAVAAVAALLAYAVGVVRLRRSGVRWPWWRTASFTFGAVSLFAVTGTWLNAYSRPQPDGRRPAARHPGRWCRSARSR